LSALGFVCGAPLDVLPGKRQVLELYWHGALLKRLLFTKGQPMSHTVQLPPGESGFLEWRVKPAFNLKALGLGAETRTLGVQVFPIRSLAAGN
jgi:hypothetical protein